jgi:Tripartite tricarboxylate transporter family receptor
MLGSEAVARARPDGYTLGIVTTSTHALAPNLSASLAYDPLRDFAPVSIIGGAPYVTSTRNLSSTSRLIVSSVFGGDALLPNAFGMNCHYRSMWRPTGQPTELACWINAARVRMRGS